MLGNEESLESGKPKKGHSKEKKTSKGYAGTVQDIGWWMPKEPDDCGRKDVYYWNRIKGE